MAAALAEIQGTWSVCVPNLGNPYDNTDVEVAAETATFHDGKQMDLTCIDGQLGLAGAGRKTPFRGTLRGSVITWMLDDGETVLWIKKEALAVAPPATSHSLPVDADDSVPVVEPSQCQVMVSFNDGTAGKEAVDVTKFLIGQGYPTFCTRVYCPDSGGGASWRKATITGVQTCSVFVTLMTNGWQKSKECIWETERAIDRNAKAELVIIPVKYTDFDEVYDMATSMFVPQIGTSKQWMAKVLRGVQKALVK
uniref:TIR domain-containing protein n=1 Tax=Pyrodinium bahamense TaxID=73915 RepID=A0A7S0FPQ5_9DINO|eukprot:CAMPEP_0179149830 /NCGR_PEP_ID=MMETSP0796-20121207/72613_1 /TAXON_ID=73915 /ORGANISM="Pyrodinium bahamense, Strain pbaha01" /LENGTH=251 /DNA_ID=CAMNT_0020850715 /DNA_START=29 /DNA_END=784 /DNA_ORIENTATION=-